MRLANNAVIFLTTAHCYSWLRVAGKIRMWPDMEFMINLHNEDRIFFRARPTTNRDCHNRIMLLSVFPFMPLATTRDNDEEVV